MKKFKFNFSSCIIIEVMLLSLIILFTIWGNHFLVSMCFSMSFIILLFYTLQRANYKTFSILVILLIALSILNVVSNALLSSEAVLGFDYFKKTFMFSAFILMLYFARADKVSERTYDIVLKLPCFAAMVLILSYFFGSNTAIYAGGITLGFSNPNFTGMWLLHLFIYMFLLCIDYEKRKIMRIFFGIALIVISFLIFKTKARSCLIGLALFILLCFSGKIKLRKNTLRTITILSIILFPITLVLIYPHLIKLDLVQKLFSFITSEGKALDSRLAVWNPALKEFSKSIIIGNYSGISQGTGSAQLHNTHLDVLSSYGLIPFMLFLKILFDTCKKTMLNIGSYFGYCALCGFLSIVVVGAFEAAIVSGALGLNILTTSLILLANKNQMIDTNN